MTGIVILPAGRDDAFEDYKQFIRDGHPIEDISLSNILRILSLSSRCRPGLVEASCSHDSPDIRIRYFSEFLIF